MSRVSLIVLIGGLTAISGCSKPPRPVEIAGPDCRPLVAKVILQCWYGGRDLALSQCEVGAEEPVGCGIGPDAVARFNSGLDLSLTFSSPEREDVPRWIQFNVYRDATGRVGRITYAVNRPDDPGHLRDERQFVPRGNPSP